MPPKGYKLSEEAKINIGNASRGRKHSEETKAKLSKAKTGKRMSDEARKKTSEGRKRYYANMTKEERAEAVKNWAHKNVTEETRQKLSNSLKGQKRSKESCKNISNGLKSVWALLTPEQRRERSKNWSKAGFKASSAKTNNNTIEIAVAKVLSDANELYEQQKEMFGYFVDFYLPKRNMVIEVNGEYWHNLPERKERDANLQYLCELNDIKIVFVWESEIRINPKNALKKAIKMSK